MAKVGLTYDHTNAGLNEMQKIIQDQKLITCRVMKDSFLMGKLKKRKWSGCTRVDFPFELAESGSIQMGCYADEDEIFKGKYAKGFCDKSGFMSYALCVYEKDLIVHDGVDEESYIKLVGDQISNISKLMTSRIDNMLWNGGSLTTPIANPEPLLDGTPAGAIVGGDSNGCIYVSKPEKLRCGDRVEIASAVVTVPIVGYVTKIDVNSHKITIEDTMPGLAGGAPVDLSAILVANSPTIKPYGTYDSEQCGETFGSIDQCLGLDGSKTLFGIDRDKSPIFRGHCYDISADINPTNALDKLFETYYKMLERCMVDEADMFVSYSFFALLVKQLQYQKDYMAKDESKANYGFRSICLLGPSGQIKVTPIKCIPNDKAYILNTDSWYWYGSSGVEDPKSPSGSYRGWYETRTTKGYKYIKDGGIWGKLVCTKPISNAVIKLGTNYLSCP